MSVIEIEKLEDRALQAQQSHESTKVLTMFSHSPVDQLRIKRAIKLSEARMVEAKYNLFVATGFINPNN